MNHPAQTAVWFPAWADELRQLRLPAIRQQQYRLALIRYLRYCKDTRHRATVASARAFIESVQEQRLLSLSRLTVWKEALNWFFKEGAKPPAVHHARQPTGDGATPTMTDVPTRGAADMGKTAWERRLVEVLRSRHYQWRTELAYRHWAWRWADWLHQRQVPMDHAAAQHVRDFLTDLATRQRVSASTQEQALNALVFFLREALARDPGEFGDFTRARKLPRLPVVLTRDECQRLFAALEGPLQLMAELMYGSVDKAIGFRLSAVG